MAGGWSATRRVTARVAVLATFLALGSARAAVFAQDETLAWRLEHVAGVTPDAADTFFTALRRNVGRDDRPAVCAMVAYPLRQPESPVSDAAACVARYDAIFTLAVRKAIGTQQFEDLFVNAQGIMIGQGEVWFAPRCAGAGCVDPAIRLIAVTPQTDGLRPPKGKVLLACHAAGQYVQVRADGEGGAAFRLWRSGRPDGPPAFDLSARPSTGAPSSCGSRAWTFADGDTTYAVSDLGCAAYLAPPPMGAVGRVTLNRTGADPATAWCFE
jgi:hypothetical protein